MAGPLAIFGDLDRVAQVLGRLDPADVVASVPVDLDIHVFGAAERLMHRLRIEDAFTSCEFWIFASGIKIPRCWMRSGYRRRKGSAMAGVAWRAPGRASRVPLFISNMCCLLYNFALSVDVIFLRAAGGVKPWTSHSPRRFSRSDFKLPNSRSQQLRNVSGVKPRGSLVTHYSNPGRT